MRLFRRQETLNEQLLREAGLDPAQIREPAGVPEAVLWEAPPRTFAITRAARGALLPREDDVLATAEAPGVHGTLVRFVAFPDGSLVIEQQEGDGDVTPFANAVEERLPAPYRARATRRGRSTWTVGARAIDLRELPGLPGERVSLARHRGVEARTVDGEPVAEPLPQLEAVAPGRDDVAITAERVDGDWWELRVDAL